jgi:plastocyanin
MKIGLQNILMIVVVLAMLFVVGCSSDQVGDESTEVENEMPAIETDVVETVVVGNNQETSTFVITAENFKFLMEQEESPTLRVSQGDTVRIEFSSTDGFHDWVVDEFDAASSKVRPEDGMTVVEFIAVTKGAFEYYCSVGSHRSFGMVGNLIVE